MKLNYIKVGDYYYPNLYLEDKNNYKINKYGLLHLEYIKKYKKTLYTTLLTKNELTNYLSDISKTASNQLNFMMDYYKKHDEKLSKNNKKINPLEWTRSMNNYKTRVEEVIFRELIYV